MRLIEYELTEDDAVDFAVASMKGSPHFRRLLRFVLSLGCIIFLALAFLLHLVGAEPWMSWCFVLVGVPATLFLVQPLTWRRLPGVIRRRLRTGRNNALLGRQQLELADSGVHRRHPQSEAKLAWAAIERLTRTRQHLALYISAHQAFVVPRRAFPSPALEDAFSAEAERLSGQRFEDVAY